MSKTLASHAAPAPRAKKATARAALVDLPEASRTILMDCFRQFGIEGVAVSANAAERLHKEKFEACVIRLNPAAQAVMESARKSPSNSRMVIYGVGGNAHEAMHYSKFGINAVFHEPLERTAALKLVRSTRMLVMHEFRRYVRIPVMTEVAVMPGDGHRFTATSIELSSGGMSLKSGEEVSPGMNLEVSFALLTLPRVTVRAAVSWRKNKSFGVRFDASDDRRHPLKAWIDAFLES